MLLNKDILRLLATSLLGITALWSFHASNGYAKSVFFTNDAYLESNTGYVLLKWKSAQQVPIEVQQANTPAFDHIVKLYQGKNNSIFLSGLPDGTYYYRLRTHDGILSDVVKLKVTHHSITKAWFLFLSGAIVFVSTVWVIIRGALHES